MFPLHQSHRLDVLPCFLIPIPTLKIQPHKIKFWIMFPWMAVVVICTAIREVEPSNENYWQVTSENSNDDDKKKLMHRDIERQRRQEMATLYASLRTLLPLEYIKGKRTISDHMNGAVSYIKDLQKRIDELSAKSDELEKLSGSRGFDQGTSSNDSFPSSAVVRQSFYGVEVVISTGLGPQALTLSRVIELLLEEGLDVVCCISTRIDGGLIHTIQSEVSDLTCVDVPGLERKLNEEISPLSQISSK